MLSQSGGIITKSEDITFGCVILSELCGMHIPLELLLCVANEAAGVTRNTINKGKLSLDCHRGPQSLKEILMWRWPSH